MDRTRRGDAREQSSELMGYVRELTITGLMDEKPMMIWAAHYPSAMAKALQGFCRTPGNPTTPLKPTTCHVHPPTVAPPTNPHESSRIWSKFVLYSAPAISLHTRTGH
ncbi:hypothetical protein BGP83_03555 [Pseudomonas putida]|nr:hypothetical protein BGP83_03555 [Pseudomonas putida]